MTKGIYMTLLKIGLVLFCKIPMVKEVKMLRLVIIRYHTKTVFSKHKMFPNTTIKCKTILHV